MDSEKKAMMKNKILIIFMFLTAMTGIVFISSNYVISKVHLTFEKINLELYGNKEPQQIEENSEEEQQIQKQVEEANNEISRPQINYYGYIEIPKISLTHGLVPISSYYNTVDRTIQTIYPSDYPDVEGGNLILAAHSGSSSISYFKNLYQLSIQDEVNIVYNNTKYFYNVVNIYTVPKNGEVNIKRNHNKTTLTLITCTKDDNTTQTIYICELSSKEGV